MILVDAQFSPAIATWITTTLTSEAKAVRDVGLRDAEDTVIFFEARKQQYIVMTKDRDFVILLEKHGPPPQIIWVTCGNTSNDRLQEILATQLPRAMQLLADGEVLVEITGS